MVVSGCTAGWAAAEVAAGAAIGLVVGLALGALWAVRWARRRQRAAAADHSETLAAARQGGLQSEAATEALRVHQERVMAMLSHEIRNPIHSIVGLVDLLGQEIYGPLTERQRQTVRQITASARGLLQLVEDHLQMARDAAGRLELHLETVAARDLLEEVAESVQWLVAGKLIRLAVEAEPDLPELYTDPGKVKQVLVNLITNAVKHTPDGGAVTVRVRRRDAQCISITVADTGEGIPQEELDRIFEAFHQVGGGRGGGVGLGLSLVKRLVSLLGGEIHVGSQIGRGTTFVVVLPLRSAPRREVSDPAQRVVQAQAAVRRGGQDDAGE